MKRTLVFLFAAVAYVLALINIAYLVGFLADYGVPKGINDGQTTWLPAAILIDLALIWGFGLHHSATARTWFKRRWTRVVPPALERAVYLYMTAAATALLVIFWQPIPITVWQVENGAASMAIWALFLAVWSTMFAATFQVGHFGFFGLRQAWENLVKSRPKPPSLSATWLYAIVRHPISAGWMLVPWLTPHMTVGQLVFAVGTVAYVLVATPCEEADLISDLGDEYRNYRRRVPAFLPRLLRSKS